MVAENPAGRRSVIRYCLDRAVADICLFCFDDGGHGAAHEP